jgi:nanoRNase/pAp phosphatase (c-di-AMP/oligoRNAs hydrolase)
MPHATQTPRKLAQLHEMLAGKGSMLIVLQDSPDPDALAAGAALRKLANELAEVQCSLACACELGRAENRALAKYLDLNLRNLAGLELGEFDQIAMVDTQPGHGNQSLPADVLPQIVIDHHPRHRITQSVPFTDIRSRYGATSTILYEYLADAGIALEVPLATGLLYGIRSDTQDLGREGTQADIDAFEALYPQANKRMLAAIQRGDVQTGYFQMLARALDNSYLCGRAICCRMGEIDNPDMVGEVADLLLRHEQADWTLCWGYYQDRAMLSLRTSLSDGRADQVIRHVVGRLGAAGGHHAMAGGQIDLHTGPRKTRQRIDRLIQRRFLSATGNDEASCRKMLG